MSEEELQWLKEISTTTGISYSGDRTISTDFANKLIDYIKDLQQENAQLKEEIECLKGKSEAQDILLKKENFGKLYQCNVRLESVLKEIREYINDNSHYYSCDDGVVGFVIEEDKEETFCKDLLEIIDKGIGEDK